MIFKLHDHPQIAVYPDAASMPDLGIHMNWAPGENPVASQVGSDGVMDIVALRLGNSQLGHMHMNLLKCPLYAEVTGPFACKFSIVVFNAQGQAFLTPSFQSGIRDLTWDTPDGTAPEMIGALGVEKTWTGTLTFDPTLDQQFKTLHGWWNPGFTAVFRFDNGDEVSKLLYPSFFSLVDPTVPETAGVPFVSARVSPHDVRHRENWGDQLIETLRGTPQWLPVAPLKAGEVHRLTIATNGYGAQVADLPPAIVELREDSDIHHHGGGTVLQEITASGIINLDVVLEADALGPGLHKFIAGRRQKGLFSDAGIVTQLVFNATVAATVTPLPPPPPVVVPPVVVPPFSASFTNGVLTVCVDGHCVSFVPKP